MKTINTKKPLQQVETFIDPETKEYCNFAGTVAVYDSNIYVDTRDGTGYDKVIKKLEPLICKFTHKFNFFGNSTNDTRHDIVVYILEGIKKYDPRKNTKLSTFIEMRVTRRLINKLRDGSRMSKNATFLNIRIFHVICECGNSFNVTIENNDFNSLCSKCNRPISAAKKTPITIQEVNRPIYWDDGGLKEIEVRSTDNDQMVREEEKALDDQVICLHDLQNWLKDEDPRVIKIVELVYFHDYSISAAAEKVGLSGAGANMKLKNLQNNKRVCELFDR